MKSHYNHGEIEAKWQDVWENLRLASPELQDDNGYYCLDMFPYPSGEGLHVGHWRGYVLSDFYARYQLLQGKSVFHPMGFDAFGLPAENAAIKHKAHPKKFTDDAISNFTKQLKQIGSIFDWSKSLTTSDPNYYSWTQWLFLQLYKHGYAEKRNSLVNWCPKDQTVLANEQVVNGKCDRCGSSVTKKELSQWYFATSKMAEQLLNDLETVEWPEHVKVLQRNWIGKSEGVEIEFKTTEGVAVPVFTTRIDTLPGATALVLAPEHPLSEKLVKSDKSEYKIYLDTVLAKTNVDRSQIKESEKTALFTGSYAIHPLTNENIPIWLADYVLLEYGTGAVMAVPAHDERDNLFAAAHKLQSKVVISEDGRMINSGEFDGISSSEAAEKIIEKLGLSKTIKYRLRDWLVSRQRYWGAPIPIVYDPEGKPHPVKDEHLPLVLPDDVDFLPGGESPIARSQDYIELAEKLYGKGWRFETDTLDTFVDSSWYFLRYLSPNDNDKPFDKELVKKWLPVDLCVGGIEHATLHLLYARFMTKFLAAHDYIDSDITEPFMRLFNIGMVNLHGTKMSKSKNNIVSPDPLVEHYGTDALRGYELFMGPMDIEVEWNPRGISGIHRFLIKLWNLADAAGDNADETAQRNLEGYLGAIAPMIKNYRLNTMISQAMIYVNAVSKSGVSRDTLRQFVVTLSPIFPFISEEIYQKLGGEQKSVFMERWPSSISATITQKVIVFDGNKKLEVEIDGISEEATIEQVTAKFPELKNRTKHLFIEKDNVRILKFIN